MKKTYCISWFVFMNIVCTSFAQNTEYKKEICPLNIENIKVQIIDVVNNFELHQESIMKPDNKDSTVVLQIWKKDSTNKTLKIEEETKQKIVSPIGASCSQKWYRGNKKEKIEINLIVCSTESEMEKTVILFTKQLYSSQYDSPEIAIVGEKSWVPSFTIPQQNSYALMFKISNVFVRIFIQLKDHNRSEIIKITETLAKRIESNIIKQF